VDYSYPIRVAANKYPGRIAVIYRDQAITYAELDGNIDKLANSLLRLGLAGTRVASILLNEPITLYLYMALARIGALNIPINVRLTAEEKEYVIRDSGATTLVADGQFLAETMQLRGRVAELQQIIAVHRNDTTDATLLTMDELLESGSPEIALSNVGEDSVATIMYTSGTTGFPKGVMRTHRANLWNAVNSALGSPRLPRDIELFNLPIFGIGFLHFAMPVLLAGATLILDRVFQAERVWRLIEERRVTRTFLAPTMIDSMLLQPDQEQYDTSSLEIIYTAYEFPERLRTRAIERFGDRFVYMYGLTEAQLTCAQLGEFARKPTSVGKPMGLMRIQIVNEQGQLVPAGQIGEIALEGPSTMSGYYKLPDATNAALKDGWVLTGDLGYLDTEHDLHYTGRKKEIIKTGGFSVDPVEVENVILSLPAVREVAVIGVPDEHWGEMVVAYVVQSPGAEVTEAELVAFCKNRIADFKIPKKVVFIAELPKNPTGKVERGRLRQLWQRLVARD